MRHPTPPRGTPVVSRREPTVESAHDRLDTMQVDVEFLSYSIAEERERTEAFRDESIRSGETLRNLTTEIQAVRAKMDDHSQAIHALRRRESQLVLLGILATIALGAVVKQLIGG